LAAAVADNLAALAAFAAHGIRFSGFLEENAFYLAYFPARRMKAGYTAADA
jgi:hypothetical protein